MKVISNNPELKKSLKRAFSEECFDATFVDATHADAYDVALEEANDRKPVIVLGFKSTENIVDDSRVRKLMCKKNIGYLQVPFTLDKIKSLYLVLQRGKRIEEDPFAQELQRRYERFHSRPDRDIAMAFVTAFGSQKSLADILYHPFGKYRCT